MYLRLYEIGSSMSHYDVNPPNRTALKLLRWK
jgi:hypothetical protein